MLVKLPEWKRVPFASRYRRVFYVNMLKRNYKLKIFCSFYSNCNSKIFFIKRKIVVLNMFQYVLILFKSTVFFYLKKN